jgi:hypothetical protein
MEFSRPHRSTVGAGATPADAKRGAEGMLAGGRRRAGALEIQSLLRQGPGPEVRGLPNSCVRARAPAADPGRPSDILNMFNTHAADGSRSGLEPSAGRLKDPRAMALARCGRSGAESGAGVLDGLL